MSFLSFYPSMHELAHSPICILCQRIRTRLDNMNQNISHTERWNEKLLQLSPDEFWLCYFVEDGVISPAAEKVCHTTPSWHFAKTVKLFLPESNMSIPDKSSYCQVFCNHSQDGESSNQMKLNVYPIKFGSSINSLLVRTDAIQAYLLIGAFCFLMIS